ncbi:MAG TPA: hypothetical protein VFU82_07340 [Gammaproteobacteria bacterium]|nr:hypothetical protein [Gammaproteobacteria bacterium]
MKDRLKKHQNKQEAVIERAQSINKEEQACLDLFLAEYKSKKDAAGFFARSRITEASSLYAVMENVFRQDGEKTRSREVCISLNWFRPQGNKLECTESTPKAVKNLFDYMMWQLKVQPKVDVSKKHQNKPETVIERAQSINKEEQACLDLFLEEYKSRKDAAGFFARSRITEASSLYAVMENVFRQDGEKTRSREVCISLDWFKPQGNKLEFTESTPKAVKEVVKYYEWQMAVQPKQKK